MLPERHAKIKQCRECGTPFKPYRNRQVFCCVDCQQDWHNEKRRAGVHQGYIRGAYWRQAMIDTLKRIGQLQRIGALPTGRD